MSYRITVTLTPRSSTWAISCGRYSANRQRNRDWGQSHVERGSSARSERSRVTKLWKVWAQDVAVTSCFLDEVCEEGVSGCKANELRILKMAEYLTTKFTHIKSEGCELKPKT